MSDRVLFNGKCYSPFLIENGMKREGLNSFVAEKVFDFADKDGDGVLNGEEYNRAVCAKGYYPGQNYPQFDEDVFKDIDTNGDGILSKAEMEEYVKIEIKNKQLTEEFKEQNAEISHHDKKGSFAIGAMGAGAALFSAYYAQHPLPSSEQFAEFGIKVKRPKLLDFYNKGSGILTKLGIGVGLALAAAGITDILMANRNETKRKKLITEYSDKMYAVVEENPKSEYAKKCYKEFADYSADQADESRFAPKYIWEN